ncbi:MAG: cobyric acid synthase [Novosphingobium sp.]
MAALMFQGTGSDVGKSVLVAGFCRVLTNAGYRVLPFKPQNMSNNAAATTGGGEIGRAQALQATACRAAPHTDMNPVLLKPQSDRTAQLVLNGKAVGTADADYYRTRKTALLDAVLSAFHRLEARCDIVLVEGAGSPAETNLRGGDIANMGFARAADVPVVLIGDIDRGGVIASLVGTMAVLDPADAAMIRAFLINKFRGDVGLFADGYADIAARTGWPGLGVIPWTATARALPAEDAVLLDHCGTDGHGARHIVVPMLSRIANFDDFDPLAGEDTIRLNMVPPGQPIPADADVIILPGTKATIADLAFLRAQGWDIDIAAHLRRGGRVLGICGGYQMLGQTIADPGGVEGEAGTVAGLGHLPVHTVLVGDKTVRTVSGTDWQGTAGFSGYEIHLGDTRIDKAAAARPMLRFASGQAEGVVRADGLVAGSYIHGLFDEAPFRSHWLSGLGAASNGLAQSARVDAALDELAAHLTVHVDMAALLQLAGMEWRG